MFDIILSISDNSDVSRISVFVFFRFNTGNCAGLSLIRFYPYAVLACPNLP